MEQCNFDSWMEVWIWVRDKCKWPQREKMCYWSLYSRRGKDGTPPHPGIRKLARDMGTTPTTALAALKVLESLGAVQIVRRTVNGTDEADTNQYLLTPPWKVQSTVACPKRGRHAKGGDEPDASTPQAAASVPETSTPQGATETSTPCIPNGNTVLSKQEQKYPREVTQRSNTPPIPPTRGERRSKHTAQSDNRVKPFIDYYHHRFTEVVGLPPIINGGRDGTAIHRIPAAYDLDRLRSLLDFWLDHRHDKWIWGKGDIPAFVSALNRIVKEWNNTRGGETGLLDWIPEE